MERLCPTGHELISFGVSLVFCPFLEASRWSRLGKAVWRLLLGTVRSGFYGAVGIRRQRHACSQGGFLQDLGISWVERRWDVCCSRSAPFHPVEGRAALLAWLQVLGARC